MNIKCTTWCSVVLNLKVLCVELGGKTIVLFDSVMALSNQSDLPAFFSPQKVNYNKPERPRKMALGCWFHQIVF